MLFCDNGSEFSSQVMDLWAYHNQVKIDFSRPGKPTDNAHVESFNGTLRAECLDAHWFSNLPEASERIEAWRSEYNASRPHRALGERARHMNLQTPNTNSRFGTEKGVRSLQLRTYIGIGTANGGTSIELAHSETVVKL